MILGLKHWNDESTYYSQVNNPTEEILRKEDGKDWLESCGATATVNVLAARGDDVSIITPGEYDPQPEEVLFDYFHDPRNYQKLEAVRRGAPPKDWMGNRIPQFYPTAIKDVFGVESRFEWGMAWKYVIVLLMKEIGVVGCIQEPGHYIGFVAHDPGKNELIYREPWPGNPWPPRNKGYTGFNRRMNVQEFESNMQQFRIEIGRC